MSGIDYLDFDLELATDGGRHTARVLASPTGEAEAGFELPFSEESLENFVLKVGRARSGIRRIGSPQQEAARAFGTKLYDAVFTGEVRTCFRRSLDEADRQGRGLRVRLRLDDAPDLAPVPWEYLYSEGLGRFLVLSSHTPVVRYMDLPDRVEPLGVTAPLRVLLVVAGPSDLAPLDTTKEVANVSDALAELTEQGLVELTVLESATLADLRRVLRTGQFHVLHFIGHGGFDDHSDDGVLAFESEVGTRHLVSGHDLGTLLHDHRTLRLAVLNACEGARVSADDPFAGVAQSLVRQRIPAVVAMQFEITDEAAIAFSHELYVAVLDGYPVDAALAEARKAIFTGDNDIEWGTPVLYMRARDGQVFDISRPVRRTVPIELPPVPAAADPPASGDDKGQAAEDPPAPVDDPGPAPDPIGTTERLPVIDEDSEVPPGPDGTPAAERDDAGATKLLPRIDQEADGGGGGGRRWVLAGGAAVIVVAVLAAVIASNSGDSPDTTTTGASTTTVGTAGTGVTSDLRGGEIASDFTAVQGTATIDGSTDEWSAGPELETSSVVAGDAGGPVAGWRLMWDEAALYLLAVTNDAELTQPWEDNPSQLWRGDSVHFELGPSTALVQSSGGPRSLDAHYLFGPTPDGRVIMAVNPSDGSTFRAGGPDSRIRAAAELTDGGYLIEIAVPWEVIGVTPESGTDLAANLNISNGDGSGGLSTMRSTNPARTEQSDPNLWQILLLE